MSLPPLPPPDTHCFDDDTSISCWSHSLEQMQAYGQACRDAALDKAAQVCDAYDGTSLTPSDCANEIRRLK